MRNTSQENRTLTPYLTPMGAWALSLGTSIGWGSLIVTSNNYLLQAGPLGSVLGILVGAIIMLVIARNYHYMINRYPDAGGAYAYAREAFGYDHGFLVSWFLALTYAAMFWANASSLPLFARYFLGDMFQVGSMYTLFGYHVYLGEILLTCAFIVLTAAVCSSRRRLAVRLVLWMAAALTAMILFCAIAALVLRSGGDNRFTMQPAMLPGKNELMQVVKIACISPWAFIGFENISHASEEYTFSRTKVFRIMATAVITALVLYVLLLLLSVSAYPPEYASWYAYISNLDNIDGIKGLPPFYAAQHYLGDLGIALLLLALLGLIFTSLIGNTVALSRLLYAMARDKVIPARFAKINDRHVPSQAVLLLTVISVFIPLMGRTAIGWIVDVTTIGATLIYGFVSAAVLQTAHKQGDRREMGTGLVGLVMMLGIALYLMLPNLFASGTMAGESYMLFTIWSILGFLFFRSVLRRDGVKRFGRSVVVWIALLVMIFFASLAWMGTASMQSLDHVSQSMHYFWSQDAGISSSGDAGLRFVQEQVDIMKFSNRWHMAVVTVIFAIALIMLLSNYTMINRRIEENEVELAQARSKANTDSLTGIKNKHAYMEMESGMNQRLQMGERLAFAVVVCDVNGLKGVNDSRGHQAGDEYIRSACRLICELFAHSPVFRTGGDEFAVILTGRDYDNREYILRRLHEKSVENMQLGKVVVAAGISDFDPDADTLMETVYQRADELMYEEKEALKRLQAARG